MVQRQKPNPKGSSDLLLQCFLLGLYVSFMINKQITVLWGSRPSVWICWTWRQEYLFSLVGDPDIGGTSLAPPDDGPPLLALSWGLWASVEGSFLILVPLFLVYNVGGPLINELKMGDSDYGSYKRRLHWGFASLQDDVVFSPFLRVAGSLNGDVSILA